MKRVLQENDDFKLEIDVDEFGNLRLINTFTQGDHVDVDEMLLTSEQRIALKDYLLKDEFDF